MCQRTQHIIKVTEPEHFIYSKSTFYPKIVIILKQLVIGAYIKLVFRHTRGKLKFPAIMEGIGRQLIVFTHIVRALTGGERKGNIDMFICSHTHTHTQTWLNKLNEISGLNIIIICDQLFISLQIFILTQVCFIWLKED